MLSGSNATLFAATASRGNAGDIQIRVTDRLSLSRGARLTTSTAGRGNAGRISIDASHFLIDGGSQGQQPFSLVSSDVDPEGVGRAGDMTIRADLLTVTRGGRISSSTFSSSTLNRGRASNIQIQADRVLLNDRAQISTESRSINGGNISLTANEFLLLRDRSNISTNAGANGGNITINTPAIVALPTENSNITANAIAGNGGNVQLNATLYGISVAAQETANSDITATSDQGVQGEISVTPPNVDPVQGLVELSDNFLDALNQVTAVCPQGRNASEELDRFVVTGRGGLPDNPTENLDPETVLTEWIGVSETMAVTGDSAPFRSPISIVEARGWTIDARGQVQLVAEEATRDDRPNFSNSDCSAS